MLTRKNRPVPRIRKRGGRLMNGETGGRHAQDRNELWGTLRALINVPVSPILVPASSLIWPVPTAGCENDNIPSPNIASALKQVDSLHHHLLAASLTAGPGKLEALAAVARAGHGGKAVRQVVGYGRRRVGVAEVAATASLAARADLEAVVDGLVVDVAYFGGASKRIGRSIPGTSEVLAWGVG